MSDNITFEVDGGVAVITIDRPEVRNAIDKPTAIEIGNALDEVDARDDVSIAVLTGTGSTFCAGMDLKAFGVTKERPLHPTRGGFGIVEKPAEKPMIAAIEGNALGGGLEIALACDLIVAAESSLLGLPEVKRGFVAAAGGVLRLPTRIPRTLALELVLTGESLTSQRALTLGLINRVAPDGDSLTVALALAHQIAANAPLALRAAKRIINESVDWPTGEAFRRQEEFTGPVRSSNDAAEGARAFVEKRPPVWTNS